MTTQIHLTASQLSGYLDGDLTGVERAEVERHLDHCEECRIELAEVDMLAHPQAGNGTSRRRLVWLIAGALAASLAGITLVRSGSDPGPPDAIERPSLTPGEALPRLRVVFPAEGDTIGLADRRLAWRPLPAGTYHVALLAEDGEPLWTLDTGDTSVTIPASIRLQSGRTYFWRVDAVHDGVSATSGVIPFSIGPP
jgi:anti-sigma factor RsiW